MATGLILFMGLAVWRVAFMLNKERGPLDIFIRLRAYLAQKQKRSGGLYDMLSCFMCLSIWVAMPFALVLATDLLTWVVYTLILSGEAILLARIFDKLK